MTGSALGHRSLPGGPGARALIALGGAADAVERRIEPLAGAFAITVLEPPRRAGPRRFGVPSPPGDWLLGDPDAPDPLSLGICLEQLERFLLAREDRPLLLGAGQGATLSLALARCWPERLAGVVAIGGSAPALPPGALDERPLDGLCVAWLTDATRCARTRAEIAALRARGATLRVVAPDAALTPDALDCWLGAGGSSDGHTPRAVL